MKRFQKQLPLQAARKPEKDIS